MPSGLVPASPLLPAELVERARGLAARLHRHALGARPGTRRSRLHGGGADFAEHKPYFQGDELRHVDWRVWARSDRLVVRRHESERTVDLVLVVDRSGSMGFGTTGDRVPGPFGAWPQSKWEAAVAQALVLAQVFLQAGDRVGLIVADGAGGVTQRARGGEGTLLEIARTLCARAPDGTADLRAATEEGVLAAGRGLVVLLSDLLTEPEDAWLPALRLHGARGREGWVLHVFDPAERDFPWEEPARFIDPEGGDSLTVNPRELAAAYRQEFLAFLERERGAALGAGIRHGILDTGVDPIVPLLALLDGT